MKPTEIKRLQARARRMRVQAIAPDTFIVQSRSNRHAHHIVTVQSGEDGSIYARCTCPWAQHGGYACTHVLATLSHMAAKRDRAVSFWLSREEAERQKHRILHLAGDGKDDGIWLTTRSERSA